IYKDKQFQILPIVMGIHSPEVARDLAKALISATRELSRDTVFLASSDFNHYEPHDVTVDKDMDAINRILNLDLEGFYNTMIQRDISICGPGGIMVLMEIARIMGGKAVLLKHATSGDVQGDKSAVVGYASIKFFIE
ncbi:MAG: AmmeMemoRadiSam system protein B, partial [Desulfurococcaceae archaeon]